MSSKTIYTCDKCSKSGSEYEVAGKVVVNHPVTESRANNMYIGLELCEDCTKRVFEFVNNFINED